MEQTQTQTEVLSLDEIDSDLSSVVFISKDGVKFTINREYAKLSNVIKTTIEEDPNTTEIPFPSIQSNILQKVVEFLEHHKGEAPAIPEKPVRSKNMKEITTEWCANFTNEIAVNRETFYSLISAANYLDIQSLLHICCAKVATIIKGEPVDKIKSVLLNNEEKNEN